MPGNGRRVRAVVCDDSMVMRRLVRHVLTDDPRVEVIAEAHDGTESVELVERMEPDVVLLDVEMPGLSGLQVLAELRRRDVPVRIVMYSSDDHAREPAFERGADAYLEKGCDVELLVAALLGDGAA